jgi:putative acetyltransferase
MTSSRAPQPALRPYLPTDVPVLAAIFQASIEELAAEDYSEAQRTEWAAAADDEEAFGRRLAEALTLVATWEGQPVGFASLKDERIDMLYVDPAATGQGVGNRLCEALEKLAANRGVKHLEVEASDNAAPFFQARGFQAQTRNTVRCGSEWLATTTMRKDLAAEPGPRARVNGS